MTQKSVILRTISIVTTTVQTVKTTTKDIESYAVQLDGNNLMQNDQRVDSLYSWEKNPKDSDDSDDSDE